MNQKSGTEMAQFSGNRFAPAYWRSRLYRRTYRAAGKVRTVPEYCVRMQFSGRREEFPLGTANAAAAAEKAREIYAHLRANGWAETVGQFKKEPTTHSARLTVGEYIAAAEGLFVGKRRTFEDYAAALRNVAAAVAGIDRPASRFDYRKGGNLEWKRRVDAIALDRLTTVALTEWRVQAAKEQSRATPDSTLRQARALFGRNILPRVSEKVGRTIPSPFAAVPIRAFKNRFKMTVPPSALIASARADLEQAEPEVFKALVLCLFAGLQKLEADLLTWAQVHLDGSNPRISIKPTEYYALKTEDREREIPLSAQAVEFLRRFKAGADPVFVLHGGAPRPNARQYYRADAGKRRTWQRLAEWLKDRGIGTSKPIHALRKMGGSIIAQSRGIEQAREFLGHADIRTTSDYYVSNDARAAVEIPEQMPEPQEVRHA